MTVTAFTGFRPESLQFLVDLAGNNERSWFQPRKAEYERLLKEPLEQLCVALDRRFRARRIPLSADPKRSPFRIYRDVRFSKDKSPYKTNLAADFPWVGERSGGRAGDDSEAGAHRGIGAYLHVSPESIYAGGGMWHPEPGHLQAWRQLIDERPGEVHAVLEDTAFKRSFGELSSADSLKRVPAGYAQDHPHGPLLKLRNVVFGRELSETELFSPDLPDILADTYHAAIPVFRLLARCAPAEA